MSESLWGLIGIVIVALAEWLERQRRNAQDKKPIDYETALATGDNDRLAVLDRDLRDRVRVALEEYQRRSGQGPGG